jgi:beta-lactam-binding protein with PASTA domain/predicted Ser/Thr protein kinase
VTSSAGPPRVLAGRYRLDEVIGRGGMSTVYRGLDTSLDRVVAVKVAMDPLVERDPVYVARFKREARAAAALSNDGAVTVFDAGHDGPTRFIVMEFVPGRSLADLLREEGPLPPPRAARIAARIADTLAAAHAAGVIHRDIKPGNVMVTRDGTVKVMDFGIARMQTDITAPQTSSVIGTPTYLSPEQAQGQVVDARSDLYSLGCVLYELLAGRPPFTGDTPVAIAYKQVNETPVPPSAHNADIPPRLDAVVMKCLAKNPANRYQSAEELSADLERVKQGQDVEATPLMAAGIGGDATQVIARPQPTQVMQPPEEEGSSRKVWLGVLIGLLIFALLAAGGYLIGQALSNKDQPTVVALPDVTGQQYDAAKSKLEADPYLLVVQRTDKQSSKPEGTVLSQDPVAQSQVQTGSTVTLTVAVPFPKVTVPDVSTGCPTLEQATADLVAANLTVGETPAGTSDTCSEGTVIAQDPIAGTKIARNSPVTLTLSSGAAPITLQDYTCDVFNSVQNKLSHEGINVVFGGTKPLLSQCPNPSRIVAQDPASGTQVQAGDSVTLWTGEPPSPSASPSI